MTGKLSLCDCHSHVYGPYTRFPLAQGRAFTPPESPIESLEEVWQQNGVDRAVLIQGNAHGTDHSALLHAIARDPERRRGIASLLPDAPEAELLRLHQCGIRGIRIHWVKHLRPTVTLDQAATLLHRVQPLGWHGEVHIEAELLNQVERLIDLGSFVVVIDHMARLDASLGLNQPLFTRLIRLLEREQIWVKLSGADRVTHGVSLRAALPFMKALIRQAPEKCVWGLDWPHVNLTPKHSDHELCALFDEAVPEEQIQRKIMIENPARLYGFPIPPFDTGAAKQHEQGAAVA